MSFKNYWTFAPTLLRLYINLWVCAQFFLECFHPIPKESMIQNRLGTFLLADLHLHLGTTQLSNRHIRSKPNTVKSTLHAIMLWRLTWINKHNSHSSLRKWVTTVIPICRWRNWRTKRLRALTKGKQLINVKGKKQQHLKLGGGVGNCQRSWHESFHKSFIVFTSLHVENDSFCGAQKIPMMKYKHLKSSTKQCKNGARSTLASLLF